MAISSSFARPKAATTLTETLTLTGNFAEDVANNRWIVDITQTISATEYTVFRVYIPFSVSGTVLTVEPVVYKFPGDATAFSAGGSTPDVAEGSLGKQIDMDNFHQSAGDPRANS